MSVTYDPYFKLKLIDLSNDASVASGGGVNTQNLRPDVGYIYQIINVYYSAVDPAGSTASDHRLQMNMVDGTNTIFLNENVANTGSNLLIQRFAFYSTTEVPSASADQQRQLMGNIWADNSVYIEFKYTNNTDVNQTATRTLLVLVKEYKEGV